MNNSPIGVFDSGIGGLTVVKEIINLLPNEKVVYLGDTARVPYGSRSGETITKFALQMTNFLLGKNVKMLVVACNTICATCIDKIQEVSPVPVVGVIKPASQKIVDTTKSGRVGVVGTRATINSKIYEKEIRDLNPNIQVSTVSCPLFVPIVEEGLGESEIALLAAEKYLKDLGSIDTLHLGCTHYPLLKNVIQKVVGSRVSIIDSAIPTSIEVKEVLMRNNLLNENSHIGSQIYYFTDLSENTIQTANIFLGRDISDKSEKISL